MVDMPDEHNLLTVSPGTVQGNPARSEPILATLRLSSPAWLAHPMMTSSYASLGISVFFSARDFMT